MWSEAGERPNKSSGFKIKEIPWMLVGPVATGHVVRQLKDTIAGS